MLFTIFMSCVIILLYVFSYMKHYIRRSTRTAPPCSARRRSTTDGLGTPDPDPRNLVNRCF